MTHENLWHASFTVDLSPLHPHFQPVTCYRYVCACVSASWVFLDHTPLQLYAYTIAYLLAQPSTLMLRLLAYKPLMEYHKSCSVVGQVSPQPILHRIRHAHERIGATLTSTTKSSWCSLQQSRYAACSSKTPLFHLVQLDLLTEIQNHVSVRAHSERRLATDIARPTSTESERCDSSEHYLNMTGQRLHYFKLRPKSLLRANTDASSWHFSKARTASMRLLSPSPRTRRCFPVHSACTAVEQRYIV